MQPPGVATHLLISFDLIVRIVNFAASISFLVSFSRCFYFTFIRFVQNSFNLVIFSKITDKHSNNDDNLFIYENINENNIAS